MLVMGVALRARTMLTDSPRPGAGSSSPNVKPGHRPTRVLSFRSPSGRRDQMTFGIGRRELIILLGGAAAAWPLAARAQQPARLPLVAILRSEVAGDSEGLRNSAALVQGLQALGWTEGRNVRIEKGWAGGSVDAMKALARELVALEPNVIVVISTPVTAAVMQETHTIPIIFVQNVDPVGSGFVKSLAARSEE